MCAFSRYSVSGKVTWTLFRFASACFVVKVAVSLGWPPRRVGAPESLIASFGSRPSDAQFATWKRSDGVAVVPLGLTSLDVTLIGSQLVGLTMKSARLISTLTSR